MSRPIAVGLTGLIGSGKSLVASYFAQCGVDIIDTDLISHALTAADGAAILRIEQVFGATYIDQFGALNRDKMRQLVFSDVQANEQLGEILYPLIFTQALQMWDRCTSDYVIMVVPLLFSSLRYQQIITRSIFVDCPEKILIERVCNRSGLSASVVHSILARQMPREQQIIQATDILNNNGSLEWLQQQVQQLNTKFIQLFKCKV